MPAVQPWKYCPLLPVMFMLSLPTEWALLARLACRGTPLSIDNVSAYFGYDHVQQPAVQPKEMTRPGLLQVRVSRKNMLLSAEKVMETYASHRAVLELEYFGEVGTGLGPTLEFYTLLSHELQRKGLGMWRSDTGKDSEAAAAQGNSAAHVAIISLSLCRTYAYRWRLQQKCTVCCNLEFRVLSCHGGCSSILCHACLKCHMGSAFSSRPYKEDSRTGIAGIQ